MRNKIAVLAMLVTLPAFGAVKNSSPAGFVVVETATVKARPERAYATLRDIGHWWSSEHSFSGSALNMTLELKPGGCFCETLPAGGGVQHLQVVYVDPGKAVILRGALGPLMGQGVSGAMTISFKPEGSGTKIALQYAVGGYFTDPKTDWAKAVDGVLGAQVQRLARLVDTGRAE